MNIIAHLTFNGNCREAMLFYQKCFGGELKFQSVAGSPHAENVPDFMGHSIIHSTLIKEELTIMASDMVSDELIKGNSISLMLKCNCYSEIKEIYERLSEEGIKTHPLQVTQWKTLLGDLTDKFGNQWILFYQGEN